MHEIGQKAGEVFQCYGRCICATAKARAVRQGMMQELLTGRIRLI